MKKTLILLLACCACIRSQAQTPEATAAPEPSATRTDSTLTFPEPEFIGQALAIRPDNRTEQLVQESLPRATVRPPGRNCSASERTTSTK